MLVSEHCNGSHFPLQAKNMAPLESEKVYYSLVMTSKIRHFTQDSIFKLVMCSKGERA